MNKLKQGFTLIELLIVVAIIGILAVALVPSISDAPARARDAARKTLVNNVITAVESYNIDNAGYPSELAGICLSAAGGANTTTYKLINGYLSGKAPVAQGSATMPTSITPALPAGVTTCNSAVYYISSGSGYIVGILLETSSGNSTNGTTIATEGDKRFFISVR